MQSIELILAAELAALAVGRFRTPPRGADGERWIRRRLREPTTWTDAIEAVGVPHCEIGGLTGRDDGAPVDPDSATRDGAAVRVHRPARRDLEPPRLLCDSHLGKLARILRVLGLDTLWRREWNVDELIEQARAGDRTVLSRGRALLKRREMDRAQLIRANDPLQQAEEVLARWRIPDPILRNAPFGRCSVCNGRLRYVERGRIEHRIPPKTALWLDEYYLCDGCDRLYWHGTHVMALRRRLAPLLSGRGDEPLDPTEAS